MSLLWIAANPAGVAGIVTAIIVVIFSFLVFVVSRIKKCPSDKILVIYGKVGNNNDGTSKSATCIHGGAKFIYPFFQAYQFLDLTPMSIQVDLTNALSRQNIRIDVPSRFTVGISTENGVMQNAAERLLGLKMIEIQELAKDIIFGQLRLVIATMDIEEINTDRDKFLEAVSGNVETELKKIGLRLINVNVTDINDESGYIEALGKEAAAKAINDAKKSVAEKNRDGSIGEANALRDQRIQVSTANAKAIEGENTQLGYISQSNALRREIEAEALRKAMTAEKIATAKALEDAYVAEQNAELARAAREKATLEADVIIKSEIEKQRRVIEAEALAEEIRRKAQGEADAIFAKLEAEARGNFEILSKQAEGFKEIVSSAGDNPDSAVKLLIADKLEKLVQIQVEAIKNLKFDKITVWDSGSKDGASSTSQFASSLFKSIPPMKELFEMAGMELPKYLGTEKVEEKIEEK
ncbi:MAG: flotillin [Tenericutes bacterium GWC2_34_14]|nr:MAG: flotillin [Tenericutes bacterium GWA2_35_7]OHE29246.1 MAG: flotillin [Tenericutes bacterium GWC2_34_14]OHE34329.1 MAG: flotillin [Tenericutes bacterium GWE2_34_108]OHE35681.1 MAG: flotillin [Tenericutes bacterium GWF1_35_14]OHE38896.1 MAG: flotillin [Tenericutes bacterium GWF2_35_184]OHE43928.1 MAG: flotillin [Tenericutes bacterium RIFOXYA2_FULL_36_32]OHE45656.1 MAG: flotillin [Tenericutes bacterium RIFOXYA12_FULL_35_10]OHE46367.1 MAG: flotillin [Tenericutes bacterium RIFOXYB2_FULL_3